MVRGYVLLRFSTELWDFPQEARFHADGENPSRCTSGFYRARPAFRRALTAGTFAADLDVPQLQAAPARSAEPRRTDAGAAPVRETTRARTRPESRRGHRRRGTVPHLPTEKTPRGYCSGEGTHRLAIPRCGVHCLQDSFTGSAQVGLRRELGEDGIPLLDLFEPMQRLGAELAGRFVAPPAIEQGAELLQVGVEALLRVIAGVLGGDQELPIGRFQQQELAA